MKIKVLARSVDDHLPIAHGAPAPIHKNLDPSLHPHSRSREFTRAVTASKLNRMFAKPFIGQLEGHRDGIYVMAKDPLKLTRITTGAGDGEVRVWDLATRTSTIGLRDAHKGKVTGLTFLPNRYDGEGRSTTYDQDPSPSSSKLSSKLDPDQLLDEEAGIDEDVLAAQKEEEELHDAEERTSRLGCRKLLTCGIDKVVKMWDLGPGSRYNSESDRLVMTYQGRHGFNSIDHHRRDPLFVTASDRIHIWDVNKSSPLTDLSWNASRADGSSSLKSNENYSGHQIACVTFSPSETSIIASSGSSSDRSITLYDLRTNKSLGRLIMKMRVNCLKFNPQQPSILLAGGEDHQLYTFDIRHMDSATQVFKDHVGPVMSCDWNPTGLGFVSGSYDRTLRLWSTAETTFHRKGRSIDTYHTKRMQRVFSSLTTLDSRFLLSGSDDGSIRIWKSDASEPIGVKSGRELASKEYRDKIRKKWSIVEGVGKLERQRYLPKPIYHAQKLRTEMLEARAKKEDNRQAHKKRKTRDDEYENPTSERKKGLLAIQS
ncbi:WD40-repeat-containing domain protein [Phakopsora pachyrhizi]|uniref:DDB1- and CUL4-associated factor 13 n=1 Tax=Phakopsora pachyrhizi TaxID=170000 RepID=A0AAV0ASD2_PHAPC|nr:WD40-repeat-containing domain protein [Phakopsora pachyrhizi]CAH7671391.1 WD40-repeat-containing domain protein [Phakopsora pachyrhizi]